MDSWVHKKLTKENWFSMSDVGYRRGYSLFEKKNDSKVCWETYSKEDEIEVSEVKYSPLEDLIKLREKVAKQKEIEAKEKLQLPRSEVSEELEQLKNFDFFRTSFEKATHTINILDLQDIPIKKKEVVESNGILSFREIDIHISQQQDQIDLGNSKPHIRILLEAITRNIIPINIKEIFKPLFFLDEDGLLKKLDAQMKEGIDESSSIISEEMTMINNTVILINMKDKMMGDGNGCCLASALPLLPDLEVLNLAGNRLTDKSLEALLSALISHCPKCSFLDISNNKLDSLSTNLLNLWLREVSCPLKELRLSQSDIDDEECAQMMAEIKKNHNLRSLDLSRNFIGKKEELNVVRPEFTTGAEAIAQTLSEDHNLVELNLNWNNIRGDSALALVLSLKFNSKLRLLSLAHNNLGDKIGQQLAHILRTNSTIQSLDVSYCQLLPRSLLVFAEALRINTSLKVLRISGNSLGRVAERELLSTMRHAIRENRLLLIYFHHCNRTYEDPGVFDKYNPSTSYTLDLSDPYDHMIARELHTQANQNGLVEITNCFYARPLSHTGFGTRPKNLAAGSSSALELSSSEAPRVDWIPLHFVRERLFAPPKEGIFTESTTPSDISFSSGAVNHSIYRVERSLGWEATAVSTLKTELNKWSQMRQQHNIEAKEKYHSSLNSQEGLLNHKNRFVTPPPKKSTPHTFTHSSNAENSSQLKPTIGGVNLEEDLHHFEGICHSLAYLGVQVGLLLSSNILTTVAMILVEIEERAKCSDIPSLLNIIFKSTFMYVDTMKQGVLGLEGIVKCLKLLGLQNVGVKGYCLDQDRLHYQTLGKERSNVVSDMKFEDYARCLLNNCSLVNHNKSMDEGKFIRLMMMEVTEFHSPLQGTLLIKQGGKKKQWKVPNAGTLKLDYTHDPLPCHSSDLMTDSGLKTFIDLFPIIFTALEFTELIQTAVDSHLRITCQQATFLLRDLQDNVHSKVQLVLLILPLISSPRDVTRFLTDNCSFDEMISIRTQLGQAFRVFTGNSSGHYIFDLNSPPDRLALKCLFEQTNSDKLWIKTISSRNRRVYRHLSSPLFDLDTSQSGNWIGFRNETLNGKYLLLDKYSSLPRHGILRCDFVRIQRCVPGLKSVSSQVVEKQLIPIIFKFFEEQRDFQSYVNSTDGKKVKNLRTVIEEARDIERSKKQNSSLSHHSPTRKNSKSHDSPSRTARRLSIMTFLQHIEKNKQSLGLVPQNEESKSSSEREVLLWSDIIESTWTNYCQAASQHMFSVYKAARKDYTRADWTMQEDDILENESKKAGKDKTPPSKPSLVPSIDRLSESELSSIANHAIDPSQQMDNEDHQIDQVASKLKVGYHDKVVFCKLFRDAQMRGIHTCCPYFIRKTQPINTYSSTQIRSRVTAKASLLSTYLCFEHSLKALDVCLCYNLWFSVTEVNQIIDSFLSKSAPVSLLVQCIASIFTRITDSGLFGQVVTGRLPLRIRLELFHRMGILNVWNLLSPDGYYEFDLAVRDHRKAVSLIIYLAQIEPGQNLYEENYRHCIAEMPRPGWEIPAPWTELPPAPGIATSGILTFYYTSSAKGCIPKPIVRKQLTATSCLGLCTGFFSNHSSASPVALGPAGSSANRTSSANNRDTHQKQLKSGILLQKRKVLDLQRFTLLKKKAHSSQLKDQDESAKTHPGEFNPSQSLSIENLNSDLEGESSSIHPTNLLHTDHHDHLLHLMLSSKNQDITKLTQPSPSHGTTQKSENEVLLEGVSLDEIGFYNEEDIVLHKERERYKPADLDPPGEQPEVKPSSLATPASFTPPNKYHSPLPFPTTRPSRRESRGGWGRTSNAENVFLIHSVDEELRRGAILEREIEETKGNSIRERSETELVGMSSSHQSDDGSEDLGEDEALLRDQADQDDEIGEEDEMLRLELERGFQMDVTQEGEMPTEGRAKWKKQIDKVGVAETVVNENDKEESKKNEPVEKDSGHHLRRTISSYQLKSPTSKSPSNSFNANLTTTQSLPVPNVTNQHSKIPIFNSLLHKRLSVGNFFDEDYSVANASRIATSISELKSSQTLHHLKGKKNFNSLRLSSLKKI